MQPIWIFCAFACVLIVNGQSINWQPGDWALNCDFNGNDFKRARVPGEQCSTICRQTPECTHYAWTDFEGGTCFMKKGPITKAQAVFKNIKGIVCGVVVASNEGGKNTEDGLGSNTGNKGSGRQLVKGKQIWSNEFNSPSELNEWNIEEGGHGWGNNELQMYTNRNTHIANSILTIEARREQVGNNRFTSARLRTKRQFKYGVFEMRAKVPSGRGTWAAFWMLASKRPLNWPADGEIDILEHVGFDTGRVHANIHCQAYNHLIGTNKGNSIHVDNIENDFHLYQLEWRANYMHFYVDGKEYFAFKKESSNYNVWPFDNPHDIIVNLAVGGNWGGQRGVDDSVFPKRYYIDYIRAYELGN